MILFDFRDSSVIWKNCLLAETKPTVTDSFRVPQPESRELNIISVT